MFHHFLDFLVARYLASAVTRVAAVLISSWSMEFCRQLLEECGVVATPGVGFGGMGEGYFRLSITADTETVREAGRKIEALGARIAKG